MMRFVYPNIRNNQFIGCGRYAILAGDAPAGYQLAQPNTPSIAEIREAAIIFAPHLTQAPRSVYEWKDRPAEVYQGESLDLAYLLALVQCAQHAADAPFDGDIWCTGRITLHAEQPIVKPVLQKSFELKLDAFLDRANPDRVFILPEANLAQHLRLRLQHDAEVTIAPLAEFSLPQPRSAKTIVPVRRAELLRLVTLFFPGVAAARSTVPARARLRMPLHIWLIMGLSVLLTGGGLAAGWRYVQQRTPSAPVAQKEFRILVKNSQGRLISAQHGIYEVRPGETMTIIVHPENLAGGRVTIAYCAVRGHIDAGAAYIAPDQPGLTDIITIRALDAKRPAEILYQDAIRIKTIP